MDENELKHWGILNMKWGVRRFQYPDGSLTPEGRIRYGVGDKAKKIIGDAGKKENKKKPEIMSNEELYETTKRNKALANYYNSQNDYLKAQSYYNSITHPPKKTNQFLQNIFIRPLENVFSKTLEFTAYSSIAALLDATGNEYAEDFVRYAIGGKNHNRRRDDDDDDDRNHNRHRDNDHRNDNSGGRNDRNRNGNGFNHNESITEEFTFEQNNNDIPSFIYSLESSGTGASRDPNSINRPNITKEEWRKLQKEAHEWNEKNKI